LSLTLILMVTFKPTFISWKKKSIHLQRNHFDVHFDVHNPCFQCLIYAKYSQNLTM
jgi:hypothetical protein